MKQITVVGSANIDLTFRTVQLPRPGETTFGTGYSQGFGGKGANQAVAAARLGAQVAFVGKVGADDHGAAIRAQLIGERIGLTHFGIDPGRVTGVAAILVDNAGENCIVGVPGANLGLEPADMMSAAALLRSSRVLLAPCETKIETLVEAFALASKAGVICILNPAPARDLPDELLRHVDICVPNETELSALTNGACTSIRDVEQGARAMRARGPKCVVVTMGPRGALVVQADSATHVPAPIVKAVDTTGAGDAFCGALATRLADGLPIVEAARFANRVAALSVTRPGAQMSFPVAAELLLHSES